MRNRNLAFDSNTLISTFIFKNSKPGLSLELAVKEERVFSSEETFTEPEDVLCRLQFDKYIGEEDKLAGLNGFRKLTYFVNVSEAITACRDAKDNKFPELAVAANSSGIITGDDDLLLLNPFRNIPIINAKDFLKHF